MAKLKIVIGANGAGKSTWCSEHRSELPRHFYDADSIARGLGDWNDPARQRDARELVDKAIEKHLNNNEDFGFESTYSGQSRPDIIKRAARKGYAIDAVFVGTTNPNINVRRVAKRVAARTGHAVPTDEITRRWTAAQENLAATATCFNTIELLDNSKKVRQVGMLGRNLTLVHARPVPRWARKLTEELQRQEARFIHGDGNSQS